MSGDLIKFVIVLFFVKMSTFSGEAQNQFEKEVFVNHNDTLPYNILKPEKYSASLKDGQERVLDTLVYPLVLFLHGAGERGTDNEKQIIHIKDLFLDAGNRQKFQSFIVAPQCPEGKRWVEVDWSAPKHLLPNEISSPLANTIALIDQLIENYPIDTTRIYVMGLSMGGFGTWDLISRYPKKFAAAIPICGGADENLAENIRNIPIWAFHGSNDKVVMVSRSRNIIKSIRQAGGNPKYTEYKGVGHGSWVRALKEKELLEWLFEKKLE